MTPAGTRVTVVGIGAMGLPMARRLVDHAHHVTGVEPSPAGRQRATEAGLTCVASVSDAPAGDVVVVLVATGQQLLDVVDEAIDANRHLDSETWVIVSTVGPQDAATAGRRLSAHGASVVDAPVTGGVPGAEAGRLRFFAAGDDRLVAGLRPVLEPLGTVLEVGTAVGDGQSMKIVNQLCSSTHLVIAAEAVAFARALGLDPARAVDVISGGSGASWFLDDRGHRMAEGADAVLTRLAILAKDNALVVAEADRVDALTPMARTAMARYAEAAERGFLEHDDSQIVRAYDTGTAQTDH